MKTIPKFGVAALLLFFSVAAFASKKGNSPTNTSAKSKNTTVTGYILHGAMQDNGSGTGGTENYTIYAYITDNVDTSYTNAIKLTQAETVYWDGATDGFSITIGVNEYYGTYVIDNYLPPHATFPVDFADVHLATPTYNGLPLTVDTHVIYFTGPF